MTQVDDLTPDEARQIAEIEARIEDFRAELAEIEEAALADDATIDLSLEEIAVLAERGGIDVPAPVRWEVSNLSAQAGWSQRLETATRSLQARHLLADSGTPAPALDRMLALFDEPVMVGHVEFEFDGNAYEFHLCADDEAAGELLALATGLFRFSVFPLEEFVSRLIVRSGLMARPHEPGGFTITAGAFLDLVAAAAGGEDPVELLVERAGAGREVATRYTAATAERLASSSVTVLCCTGPGVLEGGSLSWLDGGQHGLWRLPDDDEDTGEPAEALEVRAVTAEELLDELGSYLALEAGTA